MNDSPPDDSHLHDAEAKMRRALGLTGDTPVRSMPHQSIIGGNGSHPQRRQFVRDGDVPVTIIHHQSVGESTNQLEAARTAMRSLAAAKERAERSLVEAQAVIKDLQTKLAHERFARDEAIAHAEADRKTVEQAFQTVRTELSAEKVARERFEQALGVARSTITDLTEKFHGAQQALTTVKAELVAERQKAAEAARTPIAAATTDAPAHGEETAETVRRPRGRPRNATVAPTVEKSVKKPREKPVKWWLGKR